VESLTQKHVKILEGFIRQYPEQYFWLHRRWKTRPPEELKI
jgi:KDO2-lipid IV(A) lauroyltransferase